MCRLFCQHVSPTGHSVSRCGRGEGSRSKSQGEMIDVEEEIKYEVDWGRQRAVLKGREEGVLWELRELASPLRMQE